MCKNTHVPDKLEAYMLQVRHALYNLISLDDDFVVSVEKYDDVAIETDGTVVADQIKSVLSDNNPVTNKSISFWKTVYNWSQYLAKGEFPSKQLILRYIIVAEHDLSIGTIPRAFFDAKNETQAKDALKKAKEYLLNDNNEPQVSIECSKYVVHCFSSENEDAVIKTIVAMSLELHKKTYDDELIKKFNGQTIPPEYRKELLTHMLGWVQEQVHQYTKENKPAYISSKEYKYELMKEISGRNTNLILSAVSAIPSKMETDDEVSRRDVYIKQLELIEMDATSLFSAASDYLRTKAEVTSWANKGLVTQSNILDYNDSLIRIWENEKNIVKYDQRNDVVKGNILYSRCKNEASKKCLQGKMVPSFFGSGSLQHLANEPTDAPAIGWHPEYIKLLKEDKDE